MKQILKFVIALWLLSPLQTGLAGAINGASTNANSDSSTIDCDKRVSKIQCTEKNRNYILDNCYAVVHTKSVSSPTWNSKGRFSIVGQKPRFIPEKSEIEEFGIRTSVVKELHLKCKGRDPQTCLPTYPFARHYLTLRQARAIRLETPTAFSKRYTKEGTDFDFWVKEPLQSPQAQIFLEANPYSDCAMRESQELQSLIRWVEVKTYNGNHPTEYPKPTSSTPGFMVKSGLEHEVCDKMRFSKGKGLNAYCYKGGDVNGNGAVLVKAYRQGEMGLNNW